MSFAESSLLEGNNLKQVHQSGSMQQDCCPYTAGKIFSRYSGMDGQRTGEKWSDVQEAEDSGRPHKLGEAGSTCLESSGGSVATPWFMTSVF